MCVCLFLLGGRDDYCNVNGCATRRPRGRFYPANCYDCFCATFRGNEGQGRQCRRPANDTRLAPRLCCVSVVALNVTACLKLEAEEEWATASYALASSVVCDRLCPAHTGVLHAESQATCVRARTCMLGTHHRELHTEPQTHLLALPTSNRRGLTEPRAHTTFGAAHTRPPHSAPSPSSPASNCCCCERLYSKTLVSNGEETAQSLRSTWFNFSPIVTTCPFT